jgi:proto-oncogene tyrosine-protein kinase ROS
LKFVVTGFAVHVRLGLLFISDRSGQISRRSLEGPPSHTTILDPSRLGLIPWELSIDWLNDVLYIVGETKSKSAKWQVLRCSLQGEGLTVAVAGFQTRPLHLQVDPYNG